MNIKVGIIGGGASGLVCAITAARSGCKVKLFEKNEKFGKKILATGNGKCNVTNKEIEIANYHGEDPGFVTNLLEKFNTKECREFFKTVGLELTEDGNKIFPLSNSAKSVVELLLYECKSLEVELCSGVGVKEIEKKEQFVINGEKFDKVVLAAGSNSQSKLGGDSSGYELAKLLGHEIVPQVPSLVQLNTKEKDFFSATGVRVLGEARAVVNRERVEIAKGDILFTKYGISGNAVLDISRVCAASLEEYAFVEVEIDLFARYKKEELFNLFESSLKFVKEKHTDLWLEGFLHKKLIRAVIARSKVDKTFAKDLGKKDLNKLVHTVKNLKFEIASTKGFEYSEVSSGGVSTKEVDPVTFESKLVKDLYIVGEVLDIDGDCGGYNLHFAWGSGLIAGEAVGKK